MKKKCLALLTVAATMSVASTSFAGLAGANTVNSAAIIDGQVKTADLASSAVTATQLAAGAVTDAKIADVAMAKVTGLAAALATKADASALATKADVGHSHLYENMTVVALAGGEYTSPVDAMNDVANWCGVPSLSNPCLVKVMPGTYDVGAGNGVVLRSNVSIEGSGAAVTKITGSGASTMGNSTYTNVSLTGMTIENTADSALAVSVGTQCSLSVSDAKIIAVGGIGATGFNVAQSASLDIRDSSIQASAAHNSAGIAATDHNSITVSDVKIDVSSTSTTNYDSARGISTYSYWYGYNNSINLNDVNINASTTAAESIGVLLNGYKMINGSAKLANVKATATGGYMTKAIWVHGPYDVTLNGVTGVAVGGTAANYGLVGTSYGYGAHVLEAMSSSFTGASSAAINSGSSYAEVMNIANTKLDGPVTNSGLGVLKCIGSFDGDFGAVVCP